MSGYDPRSRPVRDGRPRYGDVSDDDFPDTRRAHRSRYDGDDDPPYTGSKSRRRDDRPDPVRRRVKGAPSDDDLDEDPRDDKYARPVPKSHGHGRDPDPILINHNGRTRSGSRTDPRMHVGLRDDDPAVHDLERKNSRANKDFRSKRDGYESDEGETLKTRKSGKGWRGDLDDNDDEPLMAGGLARRGTDVPNKRREELFGGPRRRATDMDEAPRRRLKERDDYDDNAPRRRPKDRDVSYADSPRRRDKDRDPDPDRRRRASRYDDDDYDYRPRRRRDDDHYEDRGYRSDAPRSRKYRDDDKYDDRRYRGDPRSRRTTRNDGYDSDRGPRHSDRHYKDDRRDRDRHRDRYDSDRDRDYSRDRKKRKAGFNTSDMGKYIETGSKHYQTVKPIVESLAKLYLDSKKH